MITAKEREDLTIMHDVLSNARVLIMTIHPSEPAQQVDYETLWVAYKALGSAQRSLRDLLKL